MGELFDREDWGDLFYYDYFDFVYDDDVECKFCKKGGYHWVRHETSWRLATPTGRLHKCKAYQIAATTLRDIKL